MVFAAWVDPALPDTAYHDRALAMVGAVQQLARRAPDQVTHVGNAVELTAARASGRVAAIAGVEGGHPIEGSLDKLERLFDAGVRVLTLVWDNHLPWVRSCRDGAGAGIPAGLSDFGREVVRRANEWGIVVDLSHAAERSFYDTLDVSEAPVIASHSGCQARHDHPRNLSDDQLRLLAERDGVVGIVFYPPFLSARARATTDRVIKSDRYQSVRHDNLAQLQLDQVAVTGELAGPFPVEPLLEHIEHAVEIAGIDHVGIGSDYDGILAAPHGLEDASRYGVLAEHLLQRGIDETGVRKILGGNMERVFARVTAPGTRAHEFTITPLDPEARA